MSYDSTTDLSNIINTAKTLGKMIRFPKDNEVFIDIDNVNDLAWFKEAVVVLGLTNWKQTASATSGHYHIVVDMKRTLSTMERILLQAVLGSDRKRELLAYKGMKAGNPEPSVFFEPT